MPYQGPVREFRRKSDGRLAGRVGPTYLYDEEAAHGLVDAGFPETEWVRGLAVMREESFLSPDAEGDLLRVGEPTADGRHWGKSVQVLQIRTIEEERGTGGPRDIERLKASTATAIEEAYVLWRHREIRRAGSGWTHWGAFTSGNYEKHLPWAKRVFASLKIGGTVSRPTAEDILKAAAKELGYTESPRGSNRTKFAAAAGHANAQPWCRTYVVAIAKRCGLVLPNNSAYTPTAAQGYKDLGRFDREPEVGAETFFDFPDSKNRIQHTGWLEKWGTSSWGPWVQTIDGNTSDGTGSEDNGGAVCRRVRPLRYVVGFGHPEYEEDVLAPISEERFEALEKNVQKLIDGVFAKDDKVANKASGRKTGSVLSNAFKALKAAELAAAQTAPEGDGDDQ